MSNGKWLTHLIHGTNHTQVLRSCILNSNNIGKSIINLAYNSNGIYTNLNPGVYRITIGGISYCFDLYIPVKGDSVLYIKSIYNAYAAILTDTYPIILYKVLSSINDNINELSNTINDHIDMIVMDGLSEIKIVESENLSNVSLRIPKNDEIGVLKTSPLLQDMASIVTVLDNFKLLDAYTDTTVSASGDTEDLKNDVVAIIDDKNIPNSFGTAIYTNNDYDSLSNLDFIIMNEYDIGTYNVNDLKKLVSVSSISINTSSEQLIIKLKDYIKSLPNSICDTLILNAELYKYHLILKVGRKLFTGVEDWKYIKSGEYSYLFFLKDSSVKLEDSNNNMISSHFATNRATTLISDTFDAANGIATSNNSTYSNGIFVRVPKDLIDPYYKEESFKKWINDQLLAKTPFMIDYPLSSYVYKTYLLDEYHIHTVYPTTSIEIDNKYNISYFYKALNS